MSFKVQTNRLYNSIDEYSDGCWFSVREDKTLRISLWTEDRGERPIHVYADGVWQEIIVDYR